MNALQAPSQGGRVFFMVAHKRALLFANGEARSPQQLRLQADDYLVAVDGGLRHLRTLGLKPHLLVGDFDSISAQELEECRLEGVEILRYPSQKDQTDLELALVAALGRGYRKIVIAFGLGGRLDHSLGNLALLSRPDCGEAVLRFDDGGMEVFLARGVCRTACQPGDIVSLLAWNGAAYDITTAGLAYPLSGESLQPWQTRGISNLCTGLEFEISCGEGALLVIHQRQGIRGLEDENED